MLEGSFYSVAGFCQPAPGVVEATIRLHGEHRIFEGHFPGMPVVPGVCMLHILKECLQRATASRLVLGEASNVKFLAVLDPVQHPVVDIQINFEESIAGILVKEAVIRFDATSFIRLQHAKYSPVT